MRNRLLTGYAQERSTVIGVRWRSEAAGGGAQTAEVMVHIDQEHNSVQLTHDGEVLGEVDLDTHLPPESANPAGVDDIPSDQFSTSAALATILSAMDPMVGCLIKGAAVSVAEQTRRCWQSTDKGDTSGNRAHATAG